MTGSGVQGFLLLNNYCTLFYSATRHHIVAIVIIFLPQLKVFFPAPQSFCFIYPYFPHSPVQTRTGPPPQQSFLFYNTAFTTNLPLPKLSDFSLSLAIFTWYTFQIQFKCQEAFRTLMLIIFIQSSVNHILQSPRRPYLHSFTTQWGMYV